MLLNNAAEQRCCAMLLGRVSRSPLLSAPVRLSGIIRFNFLFELELLGRKGPDLHPFRHNWCRRT